MSGATAPTPALVSSIAALFALALATAVGIGCQPGVDREYDDGSNLTGIDGAVGKPGEDGGLPDVIVTPATIGGTVTSVLGSGLALRNNDKDDLEIKSGGAFTFATRLLPGEPYAVTVRTQPTIPSQTCTVANGTGTARGIDVTNVTVACVTNTLSVGGTIAGLTGSGLVLTNNGGNDIVIAPGSTTFAFAAPIPSGGSYNVAIKTQPSGPSQTCSVSGGTGTVVSGAVTSVVVNCGTNTHTVGGTVSGLTGTVVLQNNGGNDRPLTANGSFAFSTPIVSGGTYAVTVKTQPTNQTCQITNGAGTVGAGNVTSIAVACAVTTPLSESFDGVTSPAFPAGWAATVLLGSATDNWTNKASSAQSAPNAPFIVNSSHSADVVLTSPAFTVGSSTAQLSFSNSWDMETTWDGGILEISIAGAAFQDIIAAGGAFLAGAYSGTMDTSSDCFPRREAWTGHGGGFVTTTVRLPAGAAGKSVQLRWRFCSDTGGSYVGWRIDTVAVNN
jgi:hypothetical protein